MATSRRLREERSLVVAFTGRLGGVSARPYAELNLSLEVGDERAHVLENQRRVLRALELPQSDIRSCTQVHGSAVLPAEAAQGVQPEADGLVVAEAGYAALMRFADCVPVALVSRSRAVAAALHAGRTGLEAGVIASGVTALAGYGTEPQEIMAFIGPSIGPCCYEVSPDVAADFERSLSARLGSGAPRLLSGHGHHNPRLDLWRGAEELLIAAGVPRQSIWTMRTCTSCNNDRYFSYRRDGGVTGRHGLIVAVAS